MDKNKEKRIHEMIRRYALFLAGLFIASVGVAFSARAGLGTSPVASVPYSVSLVCPVLSFGSWLNLLSVMQIITQVAVLKGKCNYPEIGVQTVVAFVYGYLTDFSCWLIRDIPVNGYPAQFVFMLLGCAILAAGIWIQFKGGVAMLPGEAMNRAVSKVTGKRYENVKIAFDIFYIAAAAAICLIFLGGLKGVREGSIIASVAVGSIIRLLNRVYDRYAEKNPHCRIRKAAGEEMLKLWGYPDESLASPTAKFFCRNIASGNAVFWTLDHDGDLIGELYVFYNLDDKDFADGESRAYLCAFRVKEGYRGQGLGRRLMNAALAELKESGFRSATIGVEADESKNIQLYRLLGFNRKIKDCHYDPCGMDENNQPEYEEEAWWLLLKDL